MVRKITEKSPAQINSLVASRILARLYPNPVRSSQLVKDLGFSESLIYKTLRGLEEEGLVYTPSRGKRFTVYALTSDGQHMVVDSILKSQKDLIDIILRTDDPMTILASVASEQVFHQLPKDLQRDSVKPLITDTMFKAIRNLVENLPQKIVKALEIVK